MEKQLTIQPPMSAPSRQHISSVISRFGRRLMAFIRQRVGNEEDAEDILQDVWQQLTITLDTGPIGQVGSWLFSVARNRIIDKYRKKKPGSLDQLLGDDEEGEGDARAELGAILLDDSRNPETIHLRNLFWKTLGEALQELPEDQKAVFVWNELEDLSFKEIAELTGENINTLISRKRYAVLHLRERLLTLYHEILQR